MKSPDNCGLFGTTGFASGNRRRGLGMHKDQLEIELRVVRNLVDGQFAQWSMLPITAYNPWDGQRTLPARR
jgi:hypothetical protein